MNEYTFMYNMTFRNIRGRSLFALLLMMGKSLSKCLGALVLRNGTMVVVWWGKEWAKVMIWHEQERLQVHKHQWFGTLPPSRNAVPWNDISRDFSCLCLDIHLFLASCSPLIHFPPTLLHLLYGVPPSTPAPCICHVLWIKGWIMVNLCVVS